MGDVFIRVSAETASAVQNLLKVAQGEEKIEGNARRAKAAVSELTRALRETGKGFTDLQGLAAQFVRIDAFSAIQAGLQALKAEFEATTGKAKDFQQTLLKIASGSGDFFNRKQIGEGLKGFNAPTATLAERAAAFDSVSDATGGTLNERLRMAEQASRAKAFGADPAEFGNLLGEMKNVFKDKNLDDLADITEFTRQTIDKFGGKLDKGGFKFLHEALGAGMKQEDALSMLLSSFAGRQGSEGANVYLNKLTEQKAFEPLKRGQGLSAAERAEREFYQMSMSQRDAALRGNADLRKQVFGTQAGGIEAMLTQDPASIKKQLGDVQSGNLFEAMIRDAMGDSVNKQLTEQVKRELKAEGLGEKTMPLKEVEEKLRTQVNELGGGSDLVGGAIASGSGGQAQLLFQNLITALTGLKESIDEQGGLNAAGAAQRDWILNKMGINTNASTE